ncbi:MAG: GNAT family N-acetyltransferase [Hyphomonadaceae bacterium]
MRYSLAERPPAPVWPAGLRFGLFGDMESRDVHGLFARAYADGQGDVGNYGSWWLQLTVDAEYDPSLCMAVYTANGRAIAAAQCWTSAFIKDFAVDPAVQRRGLGSALLHQCFTTFWARSSPVVMLKVHPDNVAARAFYRSQGMVEIPPIGG